MERIVTLQQKIAPELGQVIERRYTILRQVFFAQPIGRRGLAQRLGTGERGVRGDVEFLRAQGLLLVDASGIRLTPEGESILWDLREYVAYLRGLTRLEELIVSELGIAKAVVVAGDSDDDPAAKKEMARMAARLLKDTIRSGDVVAVTGGTTMAEVALALRPSGAPRNVTVVPARGGLGEDVEKQADSVAATIAKRLGGTYRLLGVPDVLSEDALDALATEPRIREVIDIVKRATVVVHGIGTAREMARRRGLPPGGVEFLEARGAVGETFGYYFDAAGRVVFSTPSPGLKPEDLERISHCIAVGGGRSKAQAIASVLAGRSRHILVTDEGAARHILGRAGEPGQTQE